MEQQDQPAHKQMGDSRVKASFFRCKTKKIFVCKHLICEIKCTLFTYQGRFMSLFSQYMNISYLGFWFLNFRGGISRRKDKINYGTTCSSIKI